MVPEKNYFEETDELSGQIIAQNIPPTLFVEI